jgi:phosphoesterase RecJ-like protein
MSRVIDKAAQVVRATGNIVLATHIRPDGDALGSLLGLADILGGMGKQVVCYLEEPIPAMYAFLPHAVRVETDLSQVHAFVSECGDDIMFINLDCGDLERLGKSGPELQTIHPCLVIDHHQGNAGFGDLAWVEPHRSSTGEMIYDLAVALDAEISRDAAECLYTAIVTDTGSFQYDCTSNHTFAVAGKLVSCGVQPADISQHLYDTASFGRLQLMQQVLATLQSFFTDQVAVISVSRAMLKVTGTTLEDCEGLINLPRSVAQVRVAVFLKESADDQQDVSVSLRAKGDCDVAAVAAGFNGGGHKNAAGFRMSGKTLEQVRDLLLPKLEQVLAG